MSGVTVSRRRFLGGAAALGTAAGLGGLAGCSRGERPADELLLWGVSGDQVPNQQKVLDGFTAAHPGVKVVARSVPSAVDGDATPVITAVRGGDAPDVWYMDRFTGAQYAAIGLLEPIDDLIKEFGDEGITDDYLRFGVNELTYQGRLYGLPVGTDVRALYYNKTLLRDAGVDLDELDPKNGPLTVERVFELSGKVTKKDARGNYTQMGLVPWLDQGWGYTWSIGTGAVYFDDRACGLDLTAAPVVAAFQMLADWGRDAGHSQVNAFTNSYQPPTNAAPSQSAFLAGKTAFTVQTSTTVFGLKKYAPDLEYGFTFLPVQKAGDQPYTWSGGFSVVAPKGSRMTREVWELMKFYGGKPGQQIFSPATKSLPTLKSLFDERSLADMKPFIDQLEYSTSRPPIPVSSLWWDALVQVHSAMKIGSQTPASALERAQARVGPQMEAYCPFTMPEGYGQKGL
ncbi:ABC transporter substrate-binding protein [Microlunatus flavus]|uniref:ABC-type glycerol-3-phosphate transport system, substrate-binding protein n=1 Tax=Microlunatus flavus TaxID=1036181 RepID=A0A1H9IBW8_9ACTN|nr:ABC transporter substrate-binding protein [Microlunatus flavus]SEQ72044.1 ABC-type glycerol-3-phosphate transport system, substrate-binding protein [Microlunatus flavus]